MRIVIALLSFVLAISTQCATNNNRQVTSSPDYSSHTSRETEPTTAPDMDKYLGVVKNGEFQGVWPKGTTNIPFMLTTISMMAAKAPEAAKLDLSQYEGRAIMVQGHGDSELIYNAHIIDNAGPILTTVVKHVFGLDPTSGETEPTTAPEMDKYLGVVKNGAFQGVWPKRTSDVPLKLTKISMAAAMAPEGAKLDLSKYEDCAIMVQGHESGPWIYDAHIIDNAGLILTTVVQHIFCKE